MRIGVAGSMQHTESMLSACETLRQRGHDPFVTAFAERYVGKTDSEKEDLKLHHKFNADAIREFWKLMQGADALLVINLAKDGVENYIGGNTFLEMGFAHVLGQQLFLLNPPPQNPIYTTEIEAMRPVVLNGDLSRVP